MKTLLILVLLFTVPCLARAEGTKTPEVVLRPFDTKMDLGLLGFLGGSMRYSMDGVKITRDEDFKKIIFAIHDEEASRAIHEAEDDHFVAGMFYVGGLASGADMALFFKPTPFVNVDWIDRIATGLVVLQFFMAVGALFDTNAEGHKYNAVQRYNQVVRKEEAVSLGSSPRFSFGADGMDFALTQVF